MEDDASTVGAALYLNLECRTYGALIIFHSIPSPSGLG